MTRETVETTYADLRPTDFVIDKSGQAWPISGLAGSLADMEVAFWLCDPVTKIKTHYITKQVSDPVKVSRLPTQADEAAKLEAEFPINELGDTLADVPEPRRSEMVEAINMSDAVAAVEQLLGGEVEAEVTAAEVDAANAATEDSPVSLPAFADMTILEMRSHLLILHGAYAHDLKSRAETMAMHDQAHVDQEAGRLQSAYVPHVHEEK